MFSVFNDLTTYFISYIIGSSAWNMKNGNNVKTTEEVEVSATTLFNIDFMLFWLSIILTIREGR